MTDKSFDFVWLLLHSCKFLFQVLSLFTLSLSLSCSHSHLHFHFHFNPFTFTFISPFHLQLLLFSPSSSAGRPSFTFSFTFPFMSSHAFTFIHIPISFTFTFTLHPLTCNLQLLLCSPSSSAGRPSTPNVSSLPSVKSIPGENSDSNVGWDCSQIIVQAFPDAPNLLLRLFEGREDDLMAVNEKLYYLTGFFYYLRSFSPNLCSQSLLPW